MRSHRMSACAIALTLAVGVGALLVGLSVAPQVLPGDTFRVVPRSIASASLADNDPTDVRAGWFHPVRAQHGKPLAVAVVLSSMRTGEESARFDPAPAVAPLIIGRGPAGIGGRGPPLG